MRPSPKISGTPCHHTQNSLWTHSGHPRSTRTFQLAPSYTGTMTSWSIQCQLQEPRYMTDMWTKDHGMTKELRASSSTKHQNTTGAASAAYQPQTTWHQNIQLSGILPQLHQCTSTESTWHHLHHAAPVERTPPRWWHLQPTGWFSPSTCTTPHGCPITAWHTLQSNSKGANTKQPDKAPVNNRNAGPTTISETKQAHPIGAIISKKFKGGKCNEGEVEEHFPRKDLCKVKHSNGDIEDFTAKEISEHKKPRQAHSRSQQLAVDNCKQAMQKVTRDLKMVRPQNVSPTQTTESVSSSCPCMQTSSKQWSQCIWQRISNVIAVDDKTNNKETVSTTVNSVSTSMNLWKSIFQFQI